MCFVYQTDKFSCDFTALTDCANSQSRFELWEEQVMLQTSAQRFFFAFFFKLKSAAHALKARQLGFKDLALRNKIFNFKPSKLYSKNDKDRFAVCIKPTNSCGLTALSDYTNYRSCFKLCPFENIYAFTKNL